MYIKISISDGAGTVVENTSTSQPSRAMPAAVAPSQTAPAALTTDVTAEFSDGLNAGAAPADLAAPGATGAPMPFIAAVDDGAQVHTAAQTDDMSAGAAAGQKG